ncbi:MAG TPA: HAMP domain-containing sensor histidine kinase [Solirubrobacteraceae bacterium]|nr:HAMP domain-containing sensor histidine kinase [Solirubrobacteraceae bacterium]
MGLRWRLTLLTALVVGGVMVVAASACYAVIRAELRGQVDDQLTGQGALVGPSGPGPGRRGFGPDRGLPGLPPRAGGSAPFAQLLTPSGAAVGLRGSGTIPVTSADRVIAAGDAGATLSDRDADDGSHLRVLTSPLPRGEGAVMLGRSLAGVDAALTRLRLVLGLLCLGAAALAALLGARVAGRFAALLERVEAAQASQRALVADASHELRTPVTALRTNAELLREDPDGDHRAVLDDVVEQTEELSALVTDLIELARGDGPADELQDVRLDALVAEGLERARRHAPGIAFAASLEPVALDGVPERLGRAINNLLDNAAKFSPEGGTVDVTLRGDELTVRDRGPGVPEAELPHIFDRFYRGAEAREHAGSGLGLAIVRQVAERHGGSVTAATAPGGGLSVTLTLPGARPIGTP